MILDVRSIIEDNYKLLYKESKNSQSHVKFWLLYFPVIISVLLILCGFKINGDQFSNLISFIAIIVGFLINATVILVTSQKEKGLIVEFLEKRSQANIFYTILIGILIIILIIIKSCFVNSIFEPLLTPLFVVPVTNVVIGIFTLYYLTLYSLLAHFVIMILVIVKALYSLFK